MEENQLKSMKMQNLQNRGITLIALVITIVLLLILASITIAALSGDNGILSNAAKSKVETEKASEKEQITLAYIGALAESEGGEIEEGVFGEELEKYFGRDGYQLETGTNEGEEGYIVTIEESERQYFVDKNGNVTEMTTGPKVTHSISPEGQIQSGETITITITAEATEGSITKITKPDGSVVENSNTTTYEVSENGSYTFTVEQSNGSETVYTVQITTGLAAEEFSRAYGEVDVVFLNGTTDNVSNNANAPVLGSNMVPVNFNSSTNTWQEVSESEWTYSYNNEAGTSNWANAVVKNGDEITGYFVWIPRYAYKITYYNSSHDTVIGYSDARGIVTANGGEYIGAGSRRKAGDNYVVHPTFTNDIEVGGWGSETEGIWVAKYEASSSNPGASYGGGNVTNLDVKVLPGITSWRNITRGNSYTVSRNYSTENNSHLMKNSEWGAVAYLSYSNYGVGSSTKVEQNTSSSYYTGGSNTESEIYTTNVGQSTTGNVYGVYDMNGGAQESVASYVNNGNSNLTTYGQSLITAGTSDNNEEKRTVQVYEASNGGDNSTSDSQSSNYELSGEKMFGDATYETSTSYNSSTGSWQSVFAHFPDTSRPFFLRGGGYYGSYSGVFFFYYDFGGAYATEYAFRLVLVP